jgi:hypothetical protein
VTTYPYGYSNPPKQLSLDEIFAKSQVAMLHPEYQRRFRAFMEAGKGGLGIGGAGRSSAQQERVFYERHHQVSSGGCCSYNGKRYALNVGMAHAAPPGKSFHEDLVEGRAAAVDAIGNLKWAAAFCEQFGLEQATWGGEDWHFQFTEFPHSVTQWKAQGSPPPQKWSFPIAPKPPEPTPVPPTQPLPAASNKKKGGVEMMLVAHQSGSNSYWYSQDGGLTRQLVRDPKHIRTIIYSGAEDAVSGAALSMGNWGNASVMSEADLTAYLGKATQ